MAQMLAPYNNSMRLGQGFNSYTQQICLDKAVLPDTEYNRALVAARAERKTIKLSDGSSKTTAGQLTKSSDAPKSPELKSLNGSVGDESEDAKDPDIVESKVSLAERRPKQTENKSEPAKAIQVLPWVKPQIVTYSSRFVDKLSDVTGEYMKNYVLKEVDIIRCDEHLWILVHQDCNNWWESQWIIRR
jgi:hypothetical protein